MKNLTLSQLESAFPDLIFKQGSRPSFRPPKTITLPKETDPNFNLLALHEIGHYLCKKYDYSTAIDRLKIEREAWEQAKLLCKQFDIPYDEDFAEDQLDSYRDWLHQKSTCPTCRLTRFQTADGRFHCPNCDQFRTPTKKPLKTPPDAS